MSARRAALSSYISHIEPLRLAVNRLLEAADPILSAYHDGHIDGARAATRMDALERRFAADSTDIAAIRPRTATLRSLHAVYAHTYVFEDAYLSALVVGLREHDLDDLPDTQDAQRAAIIQWRIGLEVAAREAGVKLPVDIQVAGRGEIAPAPSGS
ncbi:MAG TPA: hypothetical protein VH025_04135 [Solirubrobacteraceae bacterium]|nr:hypothetical protein [Solirubrobacteraceae bacterium]